MPPLNFSFQYDDFPYVRRRFMIDPSFTFNESDGFDGRGYLGGFYLGVGIPFTFAAAGGPTAGFIARFANYTASNNAHNDSGGGWAAAGYGGWTRETVWTRRMVLLKEGPLIVLDSIQTSEQDGGWLGGPLWQMNLDSNRTRDEPGKMPCAHVPSLRACLSEKHPVSEGDWFDLSGFSITTNQIARLRGELPERLNLVAKMGSADGRTHGVAPGFTAPFACANVTPTGGCDWWEQAGQRDRSGWQTVWSKQRIPENSRALFVSVFAPYTASGGRAAAKTIADGIAVKTVGDGATVTLTPQGAAAALTVTLDVHGVWDVQGR